MNYNNVIFEKAFGTLEQLPESDLPEICFSGRSNVGKSSLINKVLGRKSLARVSSSPGKTITINYYNVDQKVYLVDLPGYGYAKRPKDQKKVWSNLTESFFLHNPSSDALRLVLQLIDIRTGPTEDDVLMMNFMLENHIPFAVVCTKVDKLSKTQLSNALERLRQNYFSEVGIEPIPFSAVTREGKQTLWNLIESVAER